MSLRSYINALIVWQYENIYYQRRISISHMMDLCETYSSDPKKFKEEVCRFLTVNTVTDYLDNIAENPWSWQSYFSILDIPRKKAIKNSIKISYTDIMRSCERYLESYQALSGLDFVYGISCAMCGVITEEAQIRFQSSLSAFYNQFSKKQIGKILDHLYPIIYYADKDSRWWIREILIETLPDFADGIRTNISENAEAPSDNMINTVEINTQLHSDNIWGTSKLSPNIERTSILKDTEIKKEKSKNRSIRKRGESGRNNNSNVEF